MESFHQAEEPVVTGERLAHSLSHIRSLAQNCTDLGYRQQFIRRYIISSCRRHFVSREDCNRLLTDFSLDLT